ncbi:MAG: SUMF1/EgtB/PvdO family nonheme iron enzyme [Spirochaetia bacterium]|nr:SUMF1/EgtB/PvdO family nonheme iron enzyme [Spirochaetia bacterium]
MKETVGKRSALKMVLIPSGNAQIGSNRGYSEEKPIQNKMVSAFYMDCCTVTNREYKSYCDKEKIQYPDDPRWSDMPNYFLDYPEYPVVNVAWEAANSYALWAGKRLPTELEWEYAACGGVSGSLYPWGEALVDGDKANYADKNTEYPWRDFTHSSGWRCTSPVGSFPPNGYGLYDMAGNVWQWCEDWFFNYDDKERDLKYLKDGWGGSKVCRGGCYHSSSFDLRTSRRRQVQGGSAQISVGFRCVRDKNPSKADNESQPDVHFDADWIGTIACEQAVAEKGVELCLGVGKLTIERAKLIKNLGFTSVEQYVTWESVENKGQDIWDFSTWDEQVAILIDVGLKWVPFLIAGPAYSLPDWYRESRDFEGLRCLEHNIESKVQSIWDKNFYGYIERFLRAVADHYKDSDVIETPLLGISGDFGESIFPVWHGNWPTQIAGLYHSHAGYWCNDRFARNDFQNRMKEKYGTLDQLNSYWNTNWKSFDSVTIPELQIDPVDGFRVDEFTDAGLPHLKNQGARRRWLDFVDWYRGSMTDYAEYWMKTAQSCFPDKPISLCTGGDASSFHGSHFSEQCKMAAKYNGGIRITNEASDYTANFSATNWVASAGNFYNSFFSYEPAGLVNNKGIVCRLYNAIASGAKGLHYYENNLFGSEERKNLYLKFLPFFHPRNLRKNIGVFYPDTSLILKNLTGSELLKGYEMFRDYSDFIFLDDLTIEDGILDGVQVAVFCCGEVYRSKTLMKILQWVEHGGVLIGYNISNLYSAEDDESFMDKLFNSEGGIKRIGKGKSLYLPIHINIIPPEKEWIVGTHSIKIGLVETITHYQKLVFDPITKFLEDNNIVISDGILDQVFMTEMDKGSIWFNNSEEYVERYGVSLAPNTIVEILTK